MHRRQKSVEHNMGLNSILFQGKVRASIVKKQKQKNSTNNNFICLASVKT